MWSSEDLISPSPELVQLRQGIIDLLGCTGRKGEGVPYLIKAGLQGSDARSELFKIATTSWTSREVWGESFQSQAEVPSLGIQAEEAGGTCLAGGEGITVSTTAGVTAGPGDAQ